LIAKEEEIVKQGLQIILLLILTISLSGCGSPKDVVVEVDVPISVKKGDEFAMLATIKNTASKQQKLVSLDIGDAYLNGIAILRTDPDHREAFHVPLDNTMSYVFNIPVPAGKHVEVGFQAKAIAQGDYMSEIDFCINSDSSFLSRSIRTIVE
jgi:hypothetical protein